MTYSPLIYTRFQPTALTTGVTIALDTDKPTHLLLTHSAEYPTRTPRFIRRYGYTRECGFYLKWTGYHTHDQAEPGDTTQHTYLLTALDTPFPSWGAAAPSSHPIPFEPATPPFPIPASIPSNPTISLNQLIPNQIFIGGVGNAVWDNLVLSSNWPPPPPPLPIIDLSTNGLPTLDLAVTVSLSIPGTGTTTVELRDNTDTITYTTLLISGSFPPIYRYSGLYSGPALSAGGFHVLIQNGTTQPIVVGAGTFPTVISVIEQ